MVINMELMKTKILTVVDGLLTFTGLAMLFSGLIMQMDKATNFGNAVESISSTKAVNALIFVGVMMMLGFGLAFFNEWAKIKNKHSQIVKFA